MKNNKKHILDNPISENKKDKNTEKDKNDLENYFLKQKRKDPLESDEEEEQEENKSVEDENFCQYCKVKINFKTDIDNNFNENKMIENLIKIIFENKKEINNIFLDALNDMYNKDIENKKFLIFYKKLQNYCNLCMQKIFIKGGISNLDLIIKNNFLENNKKENNLKLVLSKNNLLEDKINEITNDLNNIIQKKINYKNDEKKINQISNKIDEKIINQISNKIDENIDKLIEIKSILGKIIQKNNISTFENESSNIFKNIKKIENNETSENNSKKEEKPKEIYKISDTNNIFCQSVVKEKSNKAKKYAILTKRNIYESNYEKKHKNKSKIFQYNSMNQLKNYLYNCPVLLNKYSNNIDDINEKNISSNNNLINTLSDIKSLENNCNLKKSRINSTISPLIIPYRNFSQEVEKKISKLKHTDTSNDKINNINNDNIFENENIINNKNINSNRNNELSNIKKLNTENNNINNNNILENNISNKNLLLKYLISSYQVNQKLLSQINLGINPLNSIISGINNNNLINDLINTKNFESNLNNNIPNSVNNPINTPIINNFPNINNLNPFGNNNINDNLNILNNIQSFYNPNLMNNNLNNLNSINFGLPLNIFNDMPTGLRNNNFDNLNLFPKNNQNPMSFQDKLNFINKDLNSTINGNIIQDNNSFQINNINKKENEKIKNEIKKSNNNNNSIISDKLYEESGKDKNENKN